ncbi:MAG: hemolysin family protein [Acidobacteriota bacterium]
MSGRAIIAFAALLVAAPIGLLLSALLERSGPIRLRYWSEEAGGRLRATHASHPRFEAFRFLLGVLARVALLALGLAAWAALTELGVPHATPWTLGGLALVVTASELANRLVVARDAEGALRRATWLYRVALGLLLPLIAVLERVLPFGAHRRREDEEDEASEEEIEAFIDVGAREGILDPREEELVRGVVDFGDTAVRSVMVPRIDVVAGRADASPEELAALFDGAKHTRIPLYQDSIDQVVGVLHVLDLLGHLRGQTKRPVRELMKPPFVVPETKPLNELLRDFQARGQQMAIVVDEYGGTAGLVTVEDLVEEIVGEIADEHDPGRPEPEALGAGGWRLHGRTHLEELEEIFGLEHEEAPYETVGGLVMAALGKVPKVGDRVGARGLVLTVEALRGRRVERVRAERASNEVGEELPQEAPPGERGA